MGDSAIKNREFEGSLLYFNIYSNSFWLYRCCPDTAFHSVPMSSRFTKKSLVSASGFWVKTPC